MTDLVAQRTIHTVSPRRDAALDVLVVLGAIVVAWAFSRLLLYPALNVPPHAPVILRPITGFFVCWWLLRKRDHTFARLGLRTPNSILLALLGAIALYYTMQGISRWVVPMLGERLHAEAQSSFLGYVHGNLIAFLGWLAIGILIGGVCEELLFRGFLLNRVAEVFGGWLGLTLGIVSQALLFGSLHLYGGTFAFVHASVFALVSGIFYLFVGRNLWPLIAVHALWNAIGIYSVYTG